MRILITGGAGFIGSNLVEQQNEIGKIKMIFKSKKKV